MRCPFCAHDTSQVKDSRPTEDNTAIRRRRQCEGCGARFTTFERVQLRELSIIKKDGLRQPFDRAKLERSIALALRTGSPIHCAEAVLDEAGIAVPDEQEDEVEKFREFLDQISPEDFDQGVT